MLEDDAKKWFIKSCVKLGIIIIILSLGLVGVLTLIMSIRFLRSLVQFVILIWGSIGVILLSRDLIELMWIDYKDEIIERYLDSLL